MNMEILTTILLILAGLIALLLVTALFTKKEYTVESRITIRKPVNVVYDYIRYLKNQNAYSKWATMDPDMRTEFRGTDGTPGFVSAWESDNKNVGKGEQEITAITDARRIDFALHFIQPFEARAKAWMTTEAVQENQTNVAWGFKGGMKYPMNLMLLFMNMEKMIGNDLSTGLANLKEILEKQS
jgi:hypothetical protein